MRYIQNLCLRSKKWRKTRQLRRKLKEVIGGRMMEGRKREEQEQEKAQTVF